MITKKIATYRRRCDTIARDVKEEIEAGSDVILRFNRNVDPDRILETIDLCVKNKKVKITIRHAEFRDYVEGAARGASMGMALAVAGFVLKALRAGNPVTLAMVITVSGIGALVGAIIGGGATQVGSVIIYKYREETCVRLAPAA